MDEDDERCHAAVADPRGRLDRVMLLVFFLLRREVKDEEVTKVDSKGAKTTKTVEGFVVYLWEPFVQFVLF